MIDEVQKVIVVLGMHRSGTSAITRSLELIGVGLGDNLHPAGFDNPKGFWEDRECLEINEELLCHLGSAYDRLDLAWERLKNDPFINTLNVKAKHIVNRKLSKNNGLWGFKDPRTCRLLSFWRDVFDSIGCKANFVIVVRNPLSVAMSLAKRNRTPYEKSYFLWLQHMLPAVLDSAGSPRCLIDYDLFMETPLEQVARISKSLCLPMLDSNSSVVREYKNNFLDDSLRHTRFSLKDVELDNRAPFDVVKGYKLLLSASHDEKVLESSLFNASCQELYDRLKAFGPAFSYTNALEDERTILYQNAAEHERQIASLNQEVAKRDGQINSLNQAVAKRDGQIASLNQGMAKRDGQINSIKRAAAERDMQVASLNQALHHSRLELEKMLMSNSWRITKPLRFVRRMAVSQPYVVARRTVSNGGRALWHSLPLSFSTKRKFKDALFSSFPWVFCWTKAYRAWAGSNLPQNVDSLKHGISQPPQANTNEYVPLVNGKPLREKPVKLICFYLPQFHPIPENNAWWGDGFTEWTNVKLATPQFEGHYQPRVPGDLGYYNLLDPAVMRHQVKLAELYGIEGFCFYFYWFNGKRLLEKPILNHLNDSQIHFPFCLCWANENWSRRWDGLDSEILIAQKHSPEDDFRFIEYIARYLRDPNYIRIDSRPLLIVYRPSLLPSAKKTAHRWRTWCKNEGIGEIYLAYTQSFESVDPAIYGFDAAIEFPPNNSAPPDISDYVALLKENNSCTVYDWRVFVERSEKYKPVSYKLFRGVCPSWDNTARRKNDGTVFLNNSPKLYQRWLENAIADVVKHNPNPDERLIFVNAWNEWAEGAYLEPDARYGYAWLQATRNAMSGEAYNPDKKHKILLVAHDAHPHGAQMLAANLSKTLSQGMGFHVDLVCLGDGPLIAEYSKWASVYVLSGMDARGPEAIAVAKRLYELGHRTALVNTTVSGRFLETLVVQGIECVALIHELRGVLDQNNLHRHAKAIAAHAYKIVFPAAEVAESFNLVATIPPEKIVIRPQGLYKRRDKSVRHASERSRLRQKLCLAEDSQIVLGVGFADHRKGIDLFVAAGLAMAERLPKARWVWIGHWEQTMQYAVEKQLAQHPELKDRFIFPGLQTDTDLFYGGADVFALTSREDPFPSVMLEALDAALPVVGFEGAGGFIGLLNESCGRLVPKENTEAFALAVADLLENPEIKDKLGQHGVALINARFSFRHYVFDLLDLLGMGLARVTAVVPNYNYANYLPERLESIIKQDYPIYEIIFLDDCSMDESIQVAAKALHQSSIDYRIIINEENSGSVFRQWKKGVELASGTHIWLAEADDSCSSELICELLKGYRTNGVVLSYCESQQIDETGTLLASNYLAYVSHVDATHWMTPFVVDGKREIVESLSIKNTIPNVSAVLFEKDVLKSVLENNLEKVCSYRIAGDWLVYVLVLAGGLVSFSPKPLNKHRRHKNGMTISNINKSQLEEIRRMQHYIAEHYDVPATKIDQAKRYTESLKKKHRIAVHKSG